MPTLFDPGHDSSVDESLLVRIMGEYAEMPGLSLTPEQARRLWRLDEATCRASLNRLVHRRMLKLTPRGNYVLGDGLAKRAGKER